MRFDGVTFEVPPPPWLSDRWHVQPVVIF